MSFLLKTLAAVVVLCATAIVLPQAGGILLDRHIRDVRIAASNLPEALAQLSAVHRIPIGVEALTSKDEPRNIRLKLQDGSLREVLDALLSQDSRYEWHLVNDVINVTPKDQDSRDPLVIELLDTQIGQFSATGNINTYDLRGRIVDLPEVGAKLRLAGLSAPISSYTSADTPQLGKTFSVIFSNASLRDLLNEIVRKDTSEAKYWIVQRFGDNRQYILLNFSVYEGSPTGIEDRAIKQQSRVRASILRFRAERAISAVYFARGCSNNQ